MTSRPSPGRSFIWLVLLLAFLVSGTLPAVAVGPIIGVDERGLPVALDVMRQLATDRRDPGRSRKTIRPRRGLPVRMGRDGRLTVLLIGSDWRRKSGGERFDVLIVATVDPTSGEAAMVSIPRDMGGIPFAGGGNSGGMRVNSIYFIRYRDPSLPHARIDRRGVKRFSRDIGALLGTEIDHWALVRFVPFANLIDRLGGVRVDVGQEVLDSSYHHHDSRGVWFPRERDYRLRGDPKCKPKPRKCRSALVYARSRHGTMGRRPNSDYRRAERQQDIVRAGIRKVVEQGSGLRLLGTLLLVRDLVETDIPKTAEAAAQLYSILSRMRLPASDRKVLAPATWAGLASDGTIRPNLRQIRRWVDANFYRVRAADRERG
jgi:anionic cell wall polymer biosynthesis LytR-Cps2A-Psr (LCP) family protein